MDGSNEELYSSVLQEKMWCWGQFLFSPWLLEWPCSFICASSITLLWFLHISRQTVHVIELKLGRCIHYGTPKAWLILVMLRWIPALFSGDLHPLMPWLPWNQWMTDIYHIGMLIRYWYFIAWFKICKKKKITAMLDIYFKITRIMTEEIY